MRLNQGLSFLIIALRSSIVAIADQLYTLKWYWKYPLFFKSDFKLFWRYFLSNPHKICKKKWGDEYRFKPYGETPIKTLADIATLANIGKGDLVLELGCGRGRACFWLAHCIGCRVKGIDAVPDFIKRAKELVEETKTPNLKFVCSDFFAAPFEEASIIYFYGTGQGEGVWIDLAIWLANLPKRPLIITVSAQLREFSPHFSSIGHFQAEFGWGKAEVYLQRFDEQRGSIK